jgi:hypothetical protein
MAHLRFSVTANYVLRGLLGHGAQIKCHKGGVPDGIKILGACSPQTAARGLFDFVRRFGGKQQARERHY